MPEKPTIAQPPRTSSQATPAALTPAAMDSDRLLEALAVAGNPWVYRLEGQWGAHLDLHTKTTGMEAKIRTGLKFETPLAALTDLADKLADALSEGKR